jgi:hypothetical protein
MQRRSHHDVHSHQPSMSMSLLAGMPSCVNRCAPSMMSSNRELGPAVSPAASSEVMS